MYSFLNDYSEGAHPRVLEALVATNMEQCEGYGGDRFCSRAAELIKGRFGCPEAEVHFLPGGTMTNLAVMTSLLRPHEAVVAVKSGHVAVHETGAIEATGHKILTVSGEDGKIQPQEIAELLELHHFEHMVKPRLVYISQSTELGTVYTRKELEQLYRFCREKNLLLFVDGARLGAALCSDSCDLEPAELPRCCDAFSIGGTKNGALLGETLVFCDGLLQPEFRYIMKQRGGLLAKGRTMGVQFQTLFEDELYFSLARHANSVAQRLQAGIGSLGYRMLIDSPTNQLFPILPNRIISCLQEDFRFYPWQKISCGEEGMTAVRLVTSWATPEQAADEFLRRLEGFG